MGDLYATVDLVSEMCNGSVASRHSRTSKAFHLPEIWMDACQRVPGPARAPHWAGENWCWEWMKHDGCYVVQGHTTWHAAQVKLAKKGLAPFPNVAAMHPVRNPDLCERAELGARINVGRDETKAALEWFRNNVLVYVLNLPTDTVRLKSISANLERLGIDFKRIEGVDMTKAGKYEELQVQGLIPQNFSLHKAQAAANSEAQGMGGILGTVGCAAAHLGAMSQAQPSTTGSDSHPLALVLEDDVLLADDFVPRLRRLLAQEAPCDWSAIALNSMCPFGECVSPHLTRVLPDMNVPAGRCRHGVNFGFYAMLYRRGNLAALQRRLAEIVWDEDRPRCLDVDVALASISDEVAYYAVPAVQVPGFLTTGTMGSSRARHNGVAVTGVVGASAAATVQNTTGPVDRAAVEVRQPEETAKAAPMPPPAKLQERPACAQYEAEVGCRWTESFSCPGQHLGKEGTAKDDGTLGYRCCCAYGGWKRAF